MSFGSGAGAEPSVRSSFFVSLLAGMLDSLIERASLPARGAELTAVSLGMVGVPLALPVTDGGRLFPFSFKDCMELPRAREVAGRDAAFGAGEPRETFGSGRDDIIGEDVVEEGFAVDLPC